MTLEEPRQEHFFQNQPAMETLFRTYKITPLGQCSGGKLAVDGVGVGVGVGVVVVVVAGAGAVVVVVVVVVAAAAAAS